MVAAPDQVKGKSLSLYGIVVVGFVDGGTGREIGREKEMKRRENLNVLGRAVRAGLLVGC